ncbi:MAG TPA: hypothetical protein VFX96_08475 [Pyrinomonadaceae bacterium]|nr:hypothetical protein [Pyrinomonadaceae bacterium]
MYQSSANGLRKQIAGISLIAAPLLMLACDIANRAGLGAHFVTLMKLSFVFFVGSILALVHLLRERTDGLGLVGGGMALIGCLSGSAIVTMYLWEWSFTTAGVDAATTQTVENALRTTGVPMMVVMYPLPGLFFPLGLLILSVGLLRARVVPAWAAALLALGAILFPVGRIPRIWAASMASDVALLVSLGAIGLRVLRWTTDEWLHVPAARQETVVLESQPANG